MWLGGAPHVVVETLKISLDRLKKKKSKEFSRVLSCHVAVSSEQCLLVEVSLCLVAAERPQWPRVCLLGRPRSRSRMPSLVGDSGQVLGVLGWVLTRIRNLPFVVQYRRQDVSTVAVCGTEL